MDDPSNALVRDQNAHPLVVGDVGADQRAAMRDLPELRDAMSLVWRILLLWLAVLRPGGLAARMLAPLAGEDVSARTACPPRIRPAPQAGAASRSGAS